MEKIMYIQLPSNLVKAFLYPTVQIPTHLVFEFERVATLEDFPNLLELLRTPRYFLSIIRLQDSSDSTSMILSCLSNNSNTIELSNTEDLQSIYLLINLSLVPSYADSKELAILRFPVEDLFDTREALLQYVKTVRESIHYIQSQYYEAKQKLNQSIAESEQTYNIYETISGQYRETQLALREIIGNIYELDKEVKENANKFNPELECMVCKNAFKKIMLMPCGHLVTCKECSGFNIHSCPICDHIIRDKIEVYY